MSSSNQEFQFPGFEKLTALISLLQPTPTKDDMSSSSTSSSSSSNPTEASEIEIEIEIESTVNILCEICVEKKENEKIFEIKSCNHSFCSDCVIKHVSAKIADGYSSVFCPSFNCQSIIEFDTCWKMLPKAVAEKWDKALCEALFPEAEKVFCPFKDCSAAMIILEEEGGEIIRESECPICNRLFCAMCRVPWHSEVTCEEYQNLNEDERDRDDILVKKLASQMKWMRCPRCKFFVDKLQGCLHITCRCRYEFCYACGSTWSATHGGCQPAPNH